MKSYSLLHMYHLKKEACWVNGVLVVFLNVEQSSTDILALQIYLLILTYDMHWLAKTLKPRTGEVSNIDHVFTRQCSKTLKDDWLGSCVLWGGASIDRVVPVHLIDAGSDWQLGSLGDLELFVMFPKPFLNVGGWGFTVIRYCCGHERGVPFRKGGACQCNININARIQGFPTEYCVVKTWSMFGLRSNF